MEWTFADDAESQVLTEDFFYHLENYVDVDKLLVNPEQKIRLKQAIETIRSLQIALEDAELLEIM